MCGSMDPVQHRIKTHKKRTRKVPKVDNAFGWVDLNAFVKIAKIF